VEKGDGEDMPEWVCYCTWSGVLCVGSHRMFMLLLEGLCSWNVCRAQEAERLHLNSRENERTVNLFRERQQGIPFAFAGRAMRA